MPVEIRELVIRSVLGNARESAPEASDIPRPTGGMAPDALDIDALVQECVRQVVRVLARERER